MSGNNPPRVHSTALAGQDTFTLCRVERTLLVRRRAPDFTDDVERVTCKRCVHLLQLGAKGPL